MHWLFRVEGSGISPVESPGNRDYRAGAGLEKVNETFSNAVADGSIVTAPAWPAHPDWMRQFLKILGSMVEP